MTRSLKILGLVSMVSVSAIGCSDSEIVRRSKDLVAPIEQGLAEPTGDLDATTARVLLEELYGSASAASPSAAVSDPPAGCYQGAGTEDDPRTIDMECASGGAVTGKVVSMSEEDGDDVYTLITYENTCVTGQDLCVDGDGAFVSRIGDSGFHEELNGNATVVRSGKGQEERVFGLAIVDGHAGWVFVLSGKSYVVGLANDIDLEGESHVTLEGKNGEFACSFTEHAAHGACSGSTTFEW